MKALLSDIKKEKQICAIYRLSCDPNQFSVGYILKVGEDSILMQAISPYGEYDGYIYRLIDDIASVEIDTEYLQEIKILSDYNNLTVNDLDISEDKIFSDLIGYIKREQLICTISLFNDNERCLRGLINGITDNLLKVEVVDEHGYKSGYAFADVDEISAINLQSKDENKWQILYRQKQH